MEERDEGRSEAGEDLRVAKCEYQVTSTSTTKNLQEQERSKEKKHNLVGSISGGK